MALTAGEAALARERRKEYIHSMAIEGISLTQDQRARLNYIHAQRMDASEAVEYILLCAIERGVIWPESM